MKLTIPEIGYSDLEFDNEHDIFSRKEFGLQLKNLILNSSDNTVFALDAPWGSGKSTFIKMWVKHLRKENITVLHFDAFMNDYQKDPFAAMVAEIYGLIPDDSKDEFQEMAAKATISLIRGSVNLITKLSTGGAIGIDDIEAVFSADGSKSVNTAIKSKISLIENDRNALEEFKAYLSRLRSIIDINNENKTQNKIIFVVDELDRCRPDFTLEFLERIKHIFSVSGITFLLVTNRSQINSIIKSKYGEEINPTSYLHKFINVWLSMPIEKSISAIDGVKYFNYAIRLLRDNESELTEQITINSFKQVISLFNPSFREIERMLTILAILYNTNKDKFDDVQFKVLIPVYCYIHVCSPSTIFHLKNKNFAQTCNAIAFNPDESIRADNVMICMIYDFLYFDLEASISSSMRELISQRYSTIFYPNIMNKIIYMLARIEFEDI